MVQEKRFTRTAEATLGKIHGVPWRNHSFFPRYTRPLPENIPWCVEDLVVFCLGDGDWCRQLTEEESYEKEVHNRQGNTNRLLKNSSGFLRCTCSIYIARTRLSVCLNFHIHCSMMHPGWYQSIHQLYYNSQRNTFLLGHSVHTGSHSSIEVGSVLHPYLCLIYESQVS